MKSKLNLNNKSKIKIYFLIFFLASIFIVPLVSLNIHMNLLNKSFIKFYMYQDIIFQISNRKFLKLWFLFEAIVIISIFYIHNNSKKIYHSATTEVIKGIHTPNRAGQNQHGSARFMTKDEFDKEYGSFIFDGNGRLENKLFNHEPLNENDFNKLKNRGLKTGGIAVSMTKDGAKEKIHYIDGDVHSLIVGATRAGKSRTVVIQSICTMALAEDSMIINDPKGELYDYTSSFLKRLGYNVKVLNFKNPLKSDSYNFLQPVIDSVNNENIPEAINKTWDIVTSLVDKNDKGEAIWTNGEMSVVGAAILSVVYDNKDKPEYQTMSSVYHFIAHMCKTITKVDKLGRQISYIPLEDYVKVMKHLDKNHPALELMAISDIAPSRTRGSFYTSALSTLRLFTSPYIHSMSLKSDILPKYINDKKSVVFIILPDQKTTYYPIATLFITQLYESLIEISDKYGGRLLRKCHFILDEFGNFTKIEDFTSKLTAGGGRGILFNLFLQDFMQLDIKYSKEIAKVIRSNCENWIYLQTDDIDTLEEFYKKLNTYTIHSYSLNKVGNLKDDSTLNLMSRNLLNADEIGKIRRPQTLITKRNMPVIVNAPDLSQWYFNKFLGLGDVEHNRNIRIKMLEDKKDLEIENKKNLNDLKIITMPDRFIFMYSYIQNKLNTLDNELYAKNKSKNYEKHKEELRNAIFEK